MGPAVTPSSPNPLRQESILNPIPEGRLPSPLAGLDMTPSSLKESRVAPSFSTSAIKEVLFHSASSLWGKETYEAEEAILKKVGKDSRALVIGPAGENLVKFAVIESEHGRSLGRAGIGAVMGSKKLKGIAFHGKRRREIADPSSLKRLSQEFKERVKDNQIIYMYKKYGTPMLVSIMNTIGAFPTQYWSKGTLEGWEGISAESLMERCQVSSIACPHCFMACGKISEVKQGRHEAFASWDRNTKPSMPSADSAW